MDDELGDGWTPLHIAAFQGRATLIAQLLAADADTEASTYAGVDTALFLAAVRDDQESQRLLIRHGANTFACRKNGSNIQEYAKNRLVLQPYLH